METIVPRIGLVVLVEPHYPKVGGRKPYSLESMPRIHLLQNGFSLSAPAMEKSVVRDHLDGSVCSTHAQRNDS